MMLKFSCIDYWFFNDSSAQESGGAMVAHSTFPPSPKVLLAGLRSYYCELDGVNWQRYREIDKNKDLKGTANEFSLYEKWGGNRLAGSVCIKNSFIAYGNQRLFPLPAHCLVRSRDTNTFVFCPLSMANETSVVVCSSDNFRQFDYSLIADKKYQFLEGNTLWISAEQLEALYQEEDEIQLDIIHDINSLIRRKERPHNKISPNEQDADIFTISQIGLEKQYSINTDVTTSEESFLSGVQTTIFGGRGRQAVIERSNVRAVQFGRDEHTYSVFDLIVCTPTLVTDSVSKLYSEQRIRFSEYFDCECDGICDVTLEILGTSLYSLEKMSGFDLSKNAPSKLQSFISPGAVIRFKSENSLDISRLNELALAGELYFKQPAIQNQQGCGKVIIMGVTEC